MRSERGGFSLVELMITVAIIGVLAAVAIPSYRRYLATSRASEAPGMLRRILEGATTYFYAEHVTSNGIPVVPQFPTASTEWYPVQVPRLGQRAFPGPGDPVAADVETWNQLHFTITEGVYFHYRFDSSGVGSASRADIRAEGYLYDDHLCEMMRSLWTKDASSLELVHSDLKVISPPY